MVYVQVQVRHEFRFDYGCRWIKKKRLTLREQLVVSYSINNLFLFNAGIQNIVFFSLSHG